MYIDKDLGLHHCGDDTIEYMNSLKDFYSVSYKSMRIVKQSAQTENLQAYSVEMQALVELANSIGAGYFAEIASQHLTRSEQGDKSFILRKSDELLSIWKKVLVEIKEILDDAINEGFISQNSGILLVMEELEEDLKVIRMHIEAFEDEEALEAIDNLMEFDISEELRNKLTEARLLILDSSYGSAIDILK